MVAQRGGDVLTDLFGLHFFLAPDFHLWQVVTYMFLHGSWSHVLLNMFSLWMFGASLSEPWGSAASSSIISCVAWALHFVRNCGSWDSIIWKA